MNSNEMLVIQVDIYMKSDKLEEFRRDVIRQKKDGVIVLPPYCHVLCAPKDMEIGWKQPDLEMNSGAPEPENYVLKCYDGRYVYHYTPGSSIIELTPDKTFAIVFSKARAEEMLKKVGRAYEMEEL